MAALGRRVGTLAAREFRNDPSRDEPLRFQAGGASSQAFSFTSAFLRGDRLEIKTRAPEFADWEEFDVVVAGGGTGICAFGGPACSHGSAL